MTKADLITATYKVTRSTTLLVFLLEHLKQSRNNVKNILKNRHVLLNGLLVTQFDLELSKDDVIEILKYSRPKEIKKPAKAVLKPPFKIIYNDEDFIAIDKPINTLSEVNDKTKESCFTILQDYLFKLDKNFRIYPLHRLDFETSGVLVFAKNKNVLTQLKLKWNEFVLMREYVFVSDGELPKANLTITSYLEKVGNDLMKIVPYETNIEAITNFQTLKFLNRYTLGLAYLKTGKKHQIRVQLASLKAPILGDFKYGSTYDPLKRLALHATKLVIKHPFSKEKIVITANPPQTFLNLVNYKK